MTDLIAELAEVARLSERATPGKVELHTSCSWRRIMADQWKPFLVPGIDPDGHPNMDSTDNAQFVVALVNWFRAHAAEIEAMARDAERWKGVESVMAMMTDKVEGRITSSCGLLLIDYAARVNAGKVELRFGGVSDAETGEIGDWTICIEKAAMRSAKEDGNV